MKFRRVREAQAEENGPQLNFLYNNGGRESLPLHIKAGSPWSPVSLPVGSFLTHFTNEETEAPRIPEFCNIMDSGSVTPRQAGLTFT